MELDTNEFELLKQYINHANRHGMVLEFVWTLIGDIAAHGDEPRFSLERALRDAADEWDL